MERHIAFFALLNPAHVYPTLDVCRELVRRGHRVTFPTIERFSAQLRQAGAEPLIIEAPEFSSVEATLRYPPADDPKFWNVLTSVFWPTYLMTAARTVSQVEEFYRGNVPDVIAYDWPSFAGRILSHRLGCPAIQHFAHFAHRGFMTRENGTCLNPEPTHIYSQLADTFLSAYGLDVTNSLWHVEDLNIYFLPREFQFDGELFDDRFCFVGPCLNRPPRGAWKNEGGSRPLLLISESQATKETNFLEMCVEAFAGSDYHVVFSIGENSSLNSKETLPVNFQINRDSYNTEILPQASLMICQGSTGTTLEALYYGVPVLAIAPRTPYHAEVAYRLAELGLGRQLSEHSTTSSVIRESVDQMLTDEHMRTSVQDMQACMKHAGGAAAAADRIECFLDKRKRITS